MIGCRSGTVSHGIRLCLLTERAEYPRDALILSTVEVENVSDQPVVLQEFRRDNPQVNVENASGETVCWSMNPLNRFSGHGGGGRRHQVLLAPGERAQRPVYTVLRAGHLRAVVFLEQRHLEQRHLARVVGELLTVALTEDPYPRVTLDETRGVKAVIRPPQSAEGPLLYQETAECRGPGASGCGGFHLAVSGTREWTAAEGNQLIAGWPEGCRYPREWHVIAGWLNHPVATIDYVRQDRP